MCQFYNITVLKVCYQIPNFFWVLRKKPLNKEYNENSQKFTQAHLTSC